MTFPSMRPQLELQCFHDMLMRILGNEKLARAIIPPNLIGPLSCVADCLCWALHHDSDPHAVQFAELVKDLREIAEDLQLMREPLGEYVVEELG